MRMAGRIVAKILLELSQKALPGTKLSDLNRLAELRCSSFNVKPAFKGYRGYPKSVCISINEQIVHGIPTGRLLCEGDIVSFDFGVEFGGYFADSAVTVPVGRVSSKAMQLMRTTKKALYAAIEKAREGNTLKEIASAIEKTVKPFNYGIIREFVGHGIGKSLHEDPQIPNYTEGASNQVLLSNMTICIEPMISEGSPYVKILDDNWTAVTEDGKLSAHYEHTLLINKGAAEILTDWEECEFAYQIN